jgi:hypothetical protein
MFNNTHPAPRRGLQIYVSISALAFIVVGLYVGWVFYSRWQRDQAINAQAAAKLKAREQADGERVYKLMGGDQFAILNFYADPNRIEPGATADLCYSVSNAKSVKLEPQTQPVWPAFIHCVQVSPARTTAYTLTADDGAGHTKTATVQVQVHE